MYNSEQKQISPRFDRVGTTKLGIPVVLSYIKGDRAIFYCPYCKCNHHHGPQEGHRSAHCSSFNYSAYDRTGYHLLIVRKPYYMKNWYYQIRKKPEKKIIYGPDPRLSYKK